MKALTAKCLVPCIIAATAFTLCNLSVADNGLGVNGRSEEEIRLWPGNAPGTEDWTEEEVTREHEVPAGKIWIKTNITVPTLTVFQPAPEDINGTAMLVLPGGAFGALAWDLEGTEVAHWLANRGITAFVLKYRVRPYTPPPGFEPPTDFEGWIRVLRPAWKIAVEDASQAVRLLRESADDYGLSPDRIGMIGFSAGAATTLGTVLNTDKDARPDFAVSMYGMMMENSPVPADAPPLFIAMTQEDAAVPVIGSTEIFNLWSEAGRPAELHVYAKGEHGFGMRPKGLPVDHWPAVLEAWLDSLGMLPSANSVVSPPGKGAKSGP